MIADMLKQHREKEKASFHMPGHKNGAGFAGTPLSGEPFIFDTTELPDTDALIQPQGPILEAEQRAAALYGAKHSFYLVNGATGGILAMLYAAFRPGDVVILDRCCHQSVLNGAALAGIRPVYAAPAASSLSGVSGTVTPEAVTALCRQYPKVRGAVITSPNYYGAAADVAKIAAVLHEHRALLLVDEAHGAHFPFAACCPAPAMAQGADMSVTSLHKSLPAPNQTALLHIGSGQNIERVRAAVCTFQTSSPSYVLLAAMEQALEFAAARGREETAGLMERLRPLGCPSLCDPFKLLPGWGEKGISGHRAEEILQEQFGVYAEMADAHRVLLMASWHSSQADIDRLAEGLHYIDTLPPQGEPLPLPPAVQLPDGIPALTPAEVRQKPSVLLPLAEAEGHICARAVAAFPPCIPLLLPGEVITKAHLAQLRQLEASHALLTGLEGDRLAVVA